MNKRNRINLINWAKGLTDVELEAEYYRSVYDCLGSEAEEMYERGYDISDILERERYERYLSERSDVLGDLCEKRGIRLWDEEKP